MSFDITVRLQEAAKGNREVADGTRAEESHATADCLGHEAWQRLVGNPVSWESRALFLKTAARVMRRILIDHSRKAGAGKRIAPGYRAEFSEELEGVDEGDPVLLLAID